jgi:hypothetical protein
MSGLVGAVGGPVPVAKIRKTGRGRAKYLASHLSSSPNAFIGDPVFPQKSLDSRSEALRE